MSLGQLRKKKEVKRYYGQGLDPKEAMTGSSCWVPVDDDDVLFCLGKIQENSGDGKITVQVSKGSVAVALGECFAANAIKSNAGVRDLATLGRVNAATILCILRARYEVEDIYTAMGTVLVAVNPFKYVDGLYSAELLTKYASMACFGTRGSATEDEEIAPPHVWQLTARAVYCALSSAKPQSIIISGESGAGKTETTKKALELVAAASSLVSRDAAGSSRSIEYEVLSPERILCASPVLEAFGNARTVRNNNSSRFGKFTELHLTSTGMIIAAKNTNFLLERSRVVTQGRGERNYHIFYQTLAALRQGVTKNISQRRSSTLFAALPDGASADDDAWGVLLENALGAATTPPPSNKMSPKAKVHGNTSTSPADREIDADCERFAYLSISGCCRLGNDTKDEADELRQVIKAMNDLHFCHSELRFIFASISAVLLLGNINFFPALHQQQQQASMPSWTNDDKAADIDVHEIASILKLTGEDAFGSEQLAQALRTRTIQSGRRSSFAVKVLNPEAASAGRDSLCKAMYSKLFDYLIWRMNQDLKSSKDETEDDSTKQKRDVGILDVYGFELFAVNSFEQLCINLANEHLQSKFNLDIFACEIELYLNEGVSCACLTWPDNRDVIALCAKVFDDLDEEARLPRGSASNWASKLAKKYESHKRFQIDKRNANERFTISHFAGLVTYDTKYFLDKNSDNLSADLKACLDASEDARLAHLLIFDQDSPPRAFFVDTPFAHSGNDSNAHTFDVPAKSESTASIKTSVSKKFRGQLANLIKALDSTVAHYIRTVKPNAKKAPGSFVPSLVLEQLTYSGVFQTVAIQQSGWPWRYTYADFIERYGPGLAVILGIRCDTINNIVDALRTVSLQDYSIEQVAVGKTRVFLRSKASKALENIRADARRAASVVLQTVTRRYIAATIVKAALAARVECRRAGLSIDSVALDRAINSVAAIAYVGKRLSLAIPVSDSAICKLINTQSLTRIKIASFVSERSRATAWFTLRRAQSITAVMMERAAKLEQWLLEVNAAEALEASFSGQENTVESLDVDGVDTVLKNQSRTVFAYEVNDDENTVHFTKEAPPSIKLEDSHGWNLIRRLLTKPKIEQCAPSSDSRRPVGLDRLKQAIIQAETLLNYGRDARRAVLLLRRGLEDCSSSDANRGLDILSRLKRRHVVGDDFCADIAGRARAMNEGITQEISTFVQPIQNAMVSIERSASGQGSFDRDAKTEWTGDHLRAVLASNGSLQSAEAKLYALTASRIANARDECRRHDYAAVEHTLNTLKTQAYLVEERAPAASAEIALLYELAADDEVVESLEAALLVGQTSNKDDVIEPRVQIDATPLLKALAEARARGSRVDPKARAFQEAVSLLAEARAALAANDNTRAALAVETLRSARWASVAKEASSIIDSLAYRGLANALDDAIGFPLSADDENADEFFRDKRVVCFLSEEEWQTLDSRKTYQALEAADAAQPSLAAYDGVQRRAQALHTVAPLRRALRDTNWLKTEALVSAAIEAADALLSTYPGSKIAKDLKVELQNSARVAADGRLKNTLCDVILLNGALLSEYPVGEWPSTQAFDMSLQTTNEVVVREARKETSAQPFSKATYTLVDATAASVLLRNALRMGSRDAVHSELETAVQAGTKVSAIDSGTSTRVSDALKQAFREIRCAENELKDAEVRSALLEWRDTGLATALSRARKLVGENVSKFARMEFAVATRLHSLRTKAAAEAWSDDVFLVDDDLKTFSESDRSEVTALITTAADRRQRSEIISSVLAAALPSLDDAGRFEWETSEEDTFVTSVQAHESSSTTTRALVMATTRLTACRAAVHRQDWDSLDYKLDTISFELREAAKEAAPDDPHAVLALNRTATALALCGRRAACRRAALEVIRELRVGSIRGESLALAIDDVETEALAAAGQRLALHSGAAPYAAPLIAMATAVAELRHKVIVSELTKADNESETRSTLKELRAALRAVHSANLNLIGGLDWHNCPASTGEIISTELELVCHHLDDAEICYAVPKRLYFTDDADYTDTHKPWSADALLVVNACGLVEKCRALALLQDWEQLANELEDQTLTEPVLPKRVATIRHTRICNELRALRATGRDRDVRARARAALTSNDISSLRSVVDLAAIRSISDTTTSKLVRTCGLLADVRERKAPMDDATQLRRWAESCVDARAETEIRAAADAAASRRACCAVVAALKASQVAELETAAIDARAFLETRTLAASAMAVVRLRAAMATRSSATRKRSRDGSGDSSWTGRVLAAVEAVRSVLDTPIPGNETLGVFISTEVDTAETEALRERSRLLLVKAMRAGGGLEGKVGAIRLREPGSSAALARLERAVEEARRRGVEPERQLREAEAVVTCRRAVLLDYWAPNVIDEKEDADIIQSNTEVALYCAEAAERRVAAAIDRAVTATGSVQACADAERLASQILREKPSTRLNSRLEVLEVLAISRRPVEPTLASVRRRLASVAARASPDDDVVRAGCAEVEELVRAADIRRTKRDLNLALRTSIEHPDALNLMRRALTVAVSAENDTELNNLLVAGRVCLALREAVASGIDTQVATAVAETKAKCDANVTVRELLALEVNKVQRAFKQQRLVRDVPASLRGGRIHDLEKACDNAEQWADEPSGRHLVDLARALGDARAAAARGDWAAVDLATSSLIVPQLTQSTTAPSNERALVASSNPLFQPTTRVLEQERRLVRAQDKLDRLSIARDRAMARAKTEATKLAKAEIALFKSLRRKESR